MIAIFDIGKTNKKCLVFDRHYRVVWERSAVLPETTDEHGFACEDVHALTRWVRDTWADVLAQPDLEIQAVNCATYGASWVYLDENEQVVAPLYNYLKPYPDALQSQLHARYGGAAAFAQATASPVLGSLNSGLQLYRLRVEQPDLFAKIRFALHLPQYVAGLFSGRWAAELTSIGCHTALWDFQLNNYHRWVRDEGLLPKMPPLQAATTTHQIALDNRTVTVGSGLHDSSAALIPYLATLGEPFVLLSTGTWCISLNPFNHTPLTDAELQQDCLCYLTYEGQPVKAARYFGGHEHAEGVRKLAKGEEQGAKGEEQGAKGEGQGAKGKGQEANGYGPEGDYEAAYYELVLQLVENQKKSTSLVLTDNVRRLYVDGGFANNDLFLHLLARVFPEVEVYAAEVAQATALGAALAIHSAWNEGPVPTDLIQLRRIFPTERTGVFPQS